MLDFIAIGKRYYMLTGTSFEAMFPMSPLQVMICYVNSPTVVLSIFISGKGMVSNLISALANRPAALTAVQLAKRPLSVLTQNVVAGSSDAQSVSKCNLVNFGRVESHLAA